MRVLCAVDQDDRDRHVAHAAAHLAARLRADLALLHVRTPLGGDERPPAAPPPERWLLDLADELTTRTGRRPAAHVAVGTTIGELLAAAARSEAAVLVLGRRRHPRIVSAVAGTLSGDIVHAAPCPVLVVPPGSALPGDGPVVLGYAAPGADAMAAAWAGAFASRMRARVLAVHANEPDRPATPWERYAARREVLHAVQAAGALCGPRDAREEAGAPAGVLADTARDHDAALLVVGASEPGAWRELRGRAVAAALPARADRPVLVVGPRARAPRQVVAPQRAAVPARG